MFQLEPRFLRRPHPCAWVSSPLRGRTGSEKRAWRVRGERNVSPSPPRACAVSVPPSSHPHEQRVPAGGTLRLSLGKGDLVMPRPCSFPDSAPGSFSGRLVRCLTAAASCDVGSRARVTGDGCRSLVLLPLPSVTCPFVSSSPVFTQTDVQPNASSCPSLRFRLHGRVTETVPRVLAAVVGV